MGLTLNNSALASFGTALATDRNLQLGLSIIFIVIAILADAMGPRTLKGVIVVVMGVSLIGWFVTNGVFFAHTPATVPSAWDSVWGQGAYQDVVNVATKNGWTKTPVSWEATTSSIVMGTSPYFGSTNISALGGEVSQPKKSFAISFVGSIVVLTFLQALMTYSVFNTYGDFISQYDYVINGGFGSQLTTMTPIHSNLAFWSQSLTVNPVLSVIVGITPVIKLIGMTPGAFVWISRSVFAMAFDRFLPEWFTKVSDRWHSPINAVKWSLVLSLVCLTICYFALEWVAAVTVIVWSYFRTFIIGMAGVTLPYEKPHIWERGYKWAIAGVPTLAITGFINTILNMILMVMGAAGLTFSGACFTALFACLGFFWYWVFAAVNKRRGIDIGRIFATLPPE
jgi:amino acid transporter